MRVWPRWSERVATAVLRTALPEACWICGVDLPPEPLRDFADRQVTANDNENLPPGQLCEPCFAAIDVAERCCERCGAPVGPYLDTANGCGHCLKERYAFDGAFALGEYGTGLQQAVLRAKHPTGLRVAVWLADCLFAVHGQEIAAVGCTRVAAVPQHWRRRFAMPHYAADTIARRMAVQLKLPTATSILRKTRATAPQTSLSPTARRRNLEADHFEAIDMEGERVLVVDDVLTTGTTADRAARALFAAGAETVWVAVIARGVGK